MSSPKQPYITPQEHLSENQLIRYEQGQMDGAEMQRVEQHLLDCQLCSDALEGLALLEAQEAQESLHALKGQLAKRISEHKTTSRSPYWQWGIAASVLLLFSSGLFFFLQNLEMSDSVLVQKDEPITSQPAPPAQNDSNSIGSIEEKAEDQAPISSADQQAAPRPSQPLIGEDNQPAGRSIAEVKEEPKQDKLELPPVPTEEEFIAEDLELEESTLEEVTFDAEPSLAESLPADYRSSDTSTSQQAGFAKRKDLDTDLSKALVERGNSRISGTVALPAKKVSGTVMDASGEALPGVNIRLKGSDKGTVTNYKGEYSLTIPFADTSLLIDFVGYMQKEIPLDDTTFFAPIVLEESVLALEEVVVINSTRSKESASSFSSPKPLVGWRKFRKYLKENQEYTTAAKEAGAKGNVELSFTVQADGSLEDFQVVKGLGYGLNEEAIRLVKSGPKWQAAVSGNKPVPKLVQIKVPFALR